MSGREEVGVADTLVVDNKLEDTIDVWYLELALEVAVLVGQRGADEGVQSDKFKLNIVALECLPLAIDIFFDLDRVDLVKEAVLERDKGFF